MPKVISFLTVLLTPPSVHSILLRLLRCRDKSYLVLVHQMSLRGQFPCASLRWRHSLMYSASLSNFGRLHAIYWMCVWPFFLAPSLMPLKVVDQSSVTYAQMCRFLSQDVREISRFYVVLPRAFLLSVRARLCGKFKTILHKFTHLSMSYWGMYYR